MPFTLLEKTIISTILPPEATLQHEQGKISHRFLMPYIEPLKKLSADYLQKGGRQVPSIQEAEAYALYFLLINSAKVLRVTQEIPAEILARPLRILDFGCGPATASLALLSQAITPYTIDCVDSAAPMRQVGERLTQALVKSLPIANHSVHYSDSMTGSYDLICAANVFTELDADTTERTIRALIERLSPCGVIMLIEPALQHTTRNAMALRDKILTLDSSIAPLFPCTTRIPCPMLTANDRDWCHDTLRWSEPRLVQQLDELSGFNKHRLKYSGFLFQRGATVRAGLRIVTDIERSKHDHSCMVCSSGGFQKVSLPKRAVTDENRGFTHQGVYGLLEEVPKGAKVIGAAGLAQMHRPD